MSPFFFHKNGDKTKRINQIVNMINIGIIGGAGYTAGELLRLLVNHEQVTIKFVYSTSNANKPITSIHRDLLGELDVNFSSDYSADIDVLFLCSGHGKSKDFLLKNEQFSKIKIIDLSNDFRVDEKVGDYSFSYGLPEINKSKYGGHIANPGCFATAIQLGIIPAVALDVVDSEIHVHAITGSTGAGQSPMATTHFSWRQNNVSVYKAFNHQHLEEINKTLSGLTPSPPPLNFIPIRGTFTRGIFASIYFDSAVSEEELSGIYEVFYNEAPFVNITTAPIDLKQVINTNKSLIQVQKIGKKVLITSIIDNLLKGASGQAVQNMNILFDLPEDTGLKLKPMAF